MTPKQVIETLEVPLYISKAPPPLRNWVSWAPTGRSQLYRNSRGHITVWAQDARDETLCIAIHEALHAVVGKESLNDEKDSGLMALEWAVCQELDPEPYRIWRATFADYGLFDLDTGRDEIGTDDGFLSCPSWIESENIAITKGLMVPHRRPVWGLGVDASLFVD